MTSLLSADEGIGVQDSNIDPSEVPKVVSMGYSPAAPEMPLPETMTSQEIPAYFALEFPDVRFTYYLQKLSVSLGRSDSTADIDLGALKNVSRLHARIEYEEQLEQFVLAVIGRNGAFVDSVWYEPGERVPLAERCVQNSIFTSCWELRKVSAVGCSAAVVELTGFSVLPLDYTRRYRPRSSCSATYWPRRIGLEAFSSLLISSLIDA